MTAEVCTDGCFSRKGKSSVIKTGLAVSTLSDLRISDSSSSFFYEGTGLINGRRFIILRTQGEVLHLEEHSLDLDLVDNFLSIQLENAPILSGSGIFETQDYVIIVVPTINSVHLLYFTHPNRTWKKPELSVPGVKLCVPSIFNVGDATPKRRFFHISHEKGLLPSAATTGISSSQEPLVAFSFNDGRILLLTFAATVEGSDVSTDILRPTSSVKRILSGLVPSFTRNDAAAPDTALALCIQQLEEDVLLFSLSIDYRLRVWSCRQKELRSTVDLLSFLPEFQSFAGNANSALPNQDSRVQLRKALVDDTVLLAAAVWIENQCQFLLLKPSCSGSLVTVSYVRAIPSPVSEFILVDFALCGSRMFSLWLSGANESVCFSLSLDASNWADTCDWKAVQLLDYTTLAEKPKQPDILRQTIFKPGNFSFSAVLKSLKITCRAKNIAAGVSFGDWIALEKVAVIAVEDEATRNASIKRVNNNADASMAQNELWLNFYSNCLQYQMAGSKPLALLVGPDVEIVGAIRQDCFTLFSFVGHIENILTDQNEDNFLVTCLPIVAQLLQTVESELPSINSTAGEDRSADLGSWRRACALSAQALAIPSNSRSCDLILQMLAPNSSRLFTATRDIIAGVDLSNVLDFNTPTCDLDHFCRLFCASSLGSDLFTAVCDRTFKNYRDVLCSLNFLLALVSQWTQNPKLNLDFNVWRKIEAECLPPLEQLIKVYDNLYWLAELRTAEVDVSVMENSLLQFSNLNISSQAPASTKPSLGAHTVLFSFIESNENLLLRRLFNEVLLKMDLSPPLAFNEAIEVFLRTIIFTLWPSNSQLTLLDFLLSRCQYSHLLNYCQRISWCSDLKFCRLFYEGLARLNLNKEEEAKECFLKALVGVQQEDELLLKRLFPAQTINNSNVSLFSEYFLQVIRIFEVFNHPLYVIEFAKLGLKLSPANDTNKPILWTLLFKHYLELNQCEEAFVAVKQNPSIDSQRNCLRQLVVRLTESHQIDKLVSFPYGQLEQEVVEIIQHRARAVDLTTHNHYYLLYAFFIQRGNYRRAGVCMYECALRLSLEVPGLASLQKQAQCYLACISALGQARPDYAWIVRPETALPKRDIKPGMSPKRNADGTEIAESRHGEAKLKVVELSQIKKEHLLLKARITLAEATKRASPVASTPTDLITALLQNDRFDAALTLALAFELQAQLVSIVEALANKCVYCSQLGLSVAGNASEFEWLDENQTIFASHASLTTTPIDHCWQMLEAYLQKLATLSCASPLYAAAARRLLTFNYPLPSWLLMRSREVDFGELLRLLVEFDKIADACSLLCEHISLLRGQDENCLGTIGAPVWLPYSAIDQLLHILQERKHDQNAHKLLSEVEQKLKLYFADLQKLSKQAIQTLRSAVTA